MDADTSLLRDLRDAVKLGQFAVAYQPQFALDGDPVRGPVAVEALCRWNHPSLGVVMPGRFIPLAERLGMIGQIGADILARAGRQVGEWQRAGHRLGLSVNASPTEISPEFAEALVLQAGDLGLETGSLTVEITESPPLKLLPRVLESLAHLRSSGIAVSIDDYGAGETSLSKLESLSIDEVKIDRSLIQRSDRAADEEIAEVVDRADSSGWRVVAEGIETSVDLDRSRERGCGRGQGFLWGRPMSASRLESLLTVR